MLTRTSFLGMLFVLLSVWLQESGCHSHQMRFSSFPENSSFQERQILRRSNLDENDDSSSFPRMESDIFGTHSAEESLDHTRPQGETDLSNSLEETMDLSLGHPSPPIKRIKGPTLSVVNPLEILRQRLMLDLAQRRIKQNQKQIVANAQLLEDIGKRSPSVNLRQQRTSMRGNKFQP